MSSRCEEAVFSDHKGVSPIVAAIENAPHSNPTYVIIDDFPYSIPDYPAVDCGLQTIMLVPQTLEQGTLADFITLEKIFGKWNAVIAPTNAA